MIIVVGSACLTICIGDIVSSKCEVCTGKNRVHPYPPRPYPYPTRPVKSVPDPYPTRTRRSKTGKSAGTGIPADPYYTACATFPQSSSLLLESSLLLCYPPLVLESSLLLYYPPLVLESSLLLYYPPLVLSFSSSS